MIVTSFAINPGPAPGASQTELAAFATHYSASVLAGAWLQAVGPVFIVVFALTLVHLSRASASLVGWMTFFGATVLMMVSLIEVTFYMSALHVELPQLTTISLEVIHSVQHLYFIVAAPALFLPLGMVIFESRVLPRVLSYLAFLLGGGFAIIGLASLFTLTLPNSITSLGSLQGIWWLAAALTLMIRKPQTPGRVENPAG